MGDSTWAWDEQSTIPQLFANRMESNPDGEYLDVGGVKLTARAVTETAGKFGGALLALGTERHDRVATLVENSPAALLAWAGTVCAGRISVPINTAYKGDYLSHQLVNSGSRVLVVAASLFPRVATIADHVPNLEHVILVEDEEGEDENAACAVDATTVGGAVVQRWNDLLAQGLPTPSVDIAPSDLGTFVYTGGTTGPSKGCMLSHNYHEALARQIGICWRRTADDVVWTPLPLFHFNAVTTVVVGTACLRRPRRDLPTLLGVELLAGDEPGRGHHHLDARHHGLPAGPRRRPARDAQVGRAGGQHDPAPARRGAAAGRGRRGDPLAVRRRRRSAAPTASPRPAWCRGSRPGPTTGPTRPASSTTSTSTCASSTTTTTRCRRAPRARSSSGPSGPTSCSRATGVGPRPRCATSRNWWYHTGDIGRIDEDGYLYFVDRKADYLRRRGENISSFEVERILMGHGDARRRRRARRAQRR